MAYRRTPGFDAASIKVLTDELGLSLEDAARLYGRSLHLRGQAAKRTRQLTRNLGTTLKINRAEVSRLSRLEPMVICIGERTLLARTGGHRAILGVTFEQYRRMVQKAPALLTMTTDMLERNIANIEQALTGVDVRQAIARDPFLAVVNGNTLVGNVRRLAKVLGCAPDGLKRSLSRRPRLLATSAARAEKIVSTLVAGLELPRERVARLILRLPALLSQNPDTLLAHGREMAQRLGFSQHELGKVIGRAPTLMTRNPAFLERRLRELADALGWTPDEASGAVRRYPGIVSLAVDGVLARRDQMAGALGVGAGDVAWVFTRQPQLMVMNVAASVAKVELIGAIAECLGSPESPETVLKRRYPSLLSSVDRLQVLARFAREGIGPRSVRGLLLLRQSDIEALKRQAGGEGPRRVWPDE